MRRHLVSFFFAKTGEGCVTRHYVQNEVKYFMDGMT